ncbi:MAG: nitroreductase family protein [Spirochaetes bacterium]|nr:nitroreductase family protein [Spirochaetota bacterium]
MDILTSIAERRARRAISPEALEEGQTERLLAAATLAPSCFNSQPWRLVAVSSPEALESVRATFSESNAWARPAPLLVLVATKPSLDCRLDEGRDYAVFDAGSAAMSLQIQASAEGLYAHPIAGFSPKKARKALGIPDDYIVITIIVVGKPGDTGMLDGRQKTDESSERSRKPFGDVIFADKWPQNLA